MDAASAHLLYGIEDKVMQQFKGSIDYIVSDELAEVVNAAVQLHHPLLLKGEPGTGKTMLAQAISNAYQKELIVWNIKSTTTAQDGLYIYDTVQRLYDSQFGNAGVDDISKYIKLGKLGEALARNHQVVLLIDEIDKADIEFPNDLLWEIDRMEFYIPETKETIKAKFRPIIIITSNAEKELPDAFLRRCIFHSIAFPDKEMMANIISVHYPELEQILIEQVLEAFYRIRDINELQKKPGTAELLDWIGALILAGIKPERILNDLPFIGFLIKKSEDMQVVRTLGNLQGS